jgi:hypothetical protein
MKCLTKNLPQRHGSQEVIDIIDDDLVGLRDKALLTVGFAGAFRRSELAAICIANVDVRDRGADHPFLDRRASGWAKLSVSPYLMALRRCVLCGLCDVGKKQPLSRRSTL